MISHGHVYPRTDGTKAKCGGPAICGYCRAESQTQTDNAIKSAVEQHNAWLVRAKAGPEGTDSNGSPA